MIRKVLELPGKVLMKEEGVRDRPPYRMETGNSDCGT